MRRTERTKEKDGKEQLLLLVSYLTICKAKNKWIKILLMDDIQLISVVNKPVNSNLG